LDQKIASIARSAQVSQGGKKHAAQPRKGRKKEKRKKGGGRPIPYYGDPNSFHCIMVAWSSEDAEKKE